MALSVLRLNLGDTTGPGRVGEILIRPLSSSNDTSIWQSTKAARLPLKYSDPVHAPSDPAYSPEYTLLDGIKYPKVTQGAYYEFTVVRVNNTTDGTTFEAQIPATATVDFDDLAPTIVPLPTPSQLVDSAVDLALRTGTLTQATFTAKVAALKVWAKNPDQLVAGAITYTSGLLSSAIAEWPDGAPGVLTILSRQPGTDAVTSYKVTRVVGATTTTYTQPTITRDSSGAATLVPQITVA